jgi:hypothetical protein
LIPFFKLCGSYRVTQTTLKIGGELGCSWRVSSSCSTSGTRRATLVTNPVINHEWGNEWKVFTTSGNIGGLLWHRCSVVVNQASLLAITLYQGNPDRNHKVWKMESHYKLLTISVHDEGHYKLLTISVHDEGHYRNAH